MNKPKFTSIFVLIFVLALSIQNTFGQNQNQQKAKPNYEIVLQTLISSETTASQNKVPASLSGTLQKLKSNYEFADYRLISTHIQRVGSNGNISHKSLFDELNPKTDDKVFSRWSLRNLNPLTDSSGKNVLDFRSFVFEARIPLKVSVSGDKENPREVINYEPIGLTLEGFSVPANKATLIGTLAMPKSENIIFFVLTVKAVD